MLSLRNNVIFAALSVSVELVIGVVVAMMLSDDSKLSRGLISILLIPMIIAPVVSGTLWRMMVDRTYGVVNYLLSFVGIPPVSWIGDPKIALYTVTFVDTWQYIPFVAVLVLSSIKALPTSFLDAARVDGASPWKVFWKIILPIISPVIIIVAMIRFIDAFKVFDTIFVMTQGGPGNATEMLPTYIYRQGIKFLNIGYSSATAIVFVISMSLIAWAFSRLRDRQLRRLGVESCAAPRDAAQQLPQPAGAHRRAGGPVPRHPVPLLLADLQRLQDGAGVLPLPADHVPLEAHPAELRGHRAEIRAARAAC